VSGRQAAEHGEQLVGAFRDLLDQLLSVEGPHGVQVVLSTPEFVTSDGRSDLEFCNSLCQSCSPVELGVRHVQGDLRAVICIIGVDEARLQVLGCITAEQHQFVGVAIDHPLRLGGSSST